MSREERKDFTIENTDKSNPHINKLQIDYNYREIEKLKNRVKYLEEKQLEDKELLLTAVKSISIAMEDLKKK
tara:strand:- start:2510 stop:2725 length:216 start_codon:yes stop_codon:yes gene_type:complete